MDKRRHATRPLQWLLTLLLCLVVWPAQAQQIFLDDFAGCTSSSLSTQTNTAVALPSPIRVQVYYQPGHIACPDWTFSGRAYLAQYVSGTPFPGSATQAVWLNEGNGGVGDGRMNRSLTGLTVGHTYRVTAQAWIDDVDAATALGLDFGPVTASMAMAAGSGPQTISADMCATTSTLTLSLYENGATTSSPVVTNVKLEDLNIPCALAGFYTVGGTVTGLAAGQSVVLLNNGGDALTVNADGTFTFSAAVATGGAYAATVGTQPTGQVCTVTQGTGTVASANVTDILVTCVSSNTTPVPVNTPWMLALTAALLALLAARRQRG